MNIIKNIKRNIIYYKLGKHIALHIFELPKFKLQALEQRFFLRKNINKLKKNEAENGYPACELHTLDWVYKLKNGEERWQKLSGIILNSEKKEIKHYLKFTKI